jgi:hypothetical protein
MLRAAGETETTQENTQDWFELDERDPGFRLMTEEEVFVFAFISATYIIGAGIAQSV